MKTSNRDPDIRLLLRVPPPPRLPEAPRTGLEGPIQWVLGLAAVAMVWLLLATISAFIPRAGLVAERLRQRPTAWAGAAYARTNLDTGADDRVAKPAGRNSEARNPAAEVTPACAEPVS